MTLRSLILAAAFGLSAIAPAQASSFVFDLPTLTWPTPTVPDATKGCLAPATLTETSCPAS